MAALGGTAGVGAGQEVEIPDDPDDVVDGRSIVLAMDEGHNTRPFEWLRDNIREDTGVDLEAIQGFPFEGLFENLMTEFAVGSDAFDLVSFYPQYLGTFAAGGHLTPLDDMMEVWDPQIDQVLAPFRELYTQWGDHRYTLPIDGDVHMLIYRTDLFEEHNVPVPETWSEYVEAAQYFTEETDDIEYGVATYGERGFCYGWFLNRFGGLGGRYFDEDMNPEINTEAGRRALENWQETLEYAPPETVAYGYDELRDAFTRGRVAMVIQWTDVPKNVRLFEETRGLWGGAPVPGWEDGGAASAMVVGRVLGIPSYISDEQKLAAYRFAQQFHDPEYSAHMVTDPGHGLDPWMEPHLDEPELYTQQNPYREEDPDEESISFETIEEAEDYTEAVFATLEQGYPEPYWPGAQRYIEAMDIHLSNFVAGEAAVDETLENIEDDWNDIVEDLGREEQQGHYESVIEAWERAGIWD